MVRVVGWAIVRMVEAGIEARSTWRRCWRARRSFAGSSKHSWLLLSPSLVQQWHLRKFHFGGKFFQISTLTCFARSHIPGVNQKIAQLRQRHARLTSSIEHYELRVAEQQAQLARMNKPRDDYDDPPEEEPESEPEEEAPLTIEDLRREEEEVKELERKKRGLEDRVNSMGRDISGVQRALR